MKKEASTQNVNIKNKLYYQNLRDKFAGAAKDAQSSGDFILAEHNLQYAEHYKRIIAEKFSVTERVENVEDGITAVVVEKPKRKFCTKKKNITTT